VTDLYEGWNCRGFGKNGIIVYEKKGCAGLSGIGSSVQWAIRKGAIRVELDCKGV
jgi:hypothetical protein